MSATLTRSAADVWARVTTEAGLRDEMRPVLTMTMPPGLRGRTIDDVADRLGAPLGKAWLLLLGVLPIDYDDMTIVAVEPGRSFHERSRMLLLTRWEHRRSVLPIDDGGCRVVDRLTYAARWRRVEPAAARVVAWFFAHRHRRLLRWDRSGVRPGRPAVARRTTLRSAWRDARPWRGRGARPGRARP